MTESTESQVWIVDDEEAVRDSLAILLECDGFGVRSFARGEAFLAVAHELDGCLLLDLRMPEMDGFEVMEALKERDIRIPIVVVTGHGDALLERRALDAGAHAMLDKPLAEETLLTAIRSALGIDQASA